MRSLSFNETLVWIGGMLLTNVACSGTDTTRPTESAGGALGLGGVSSNGGSPNIGGSSPTGGRETSGGTTSAIGGSNSTGGNKPTGGAAVTGGSKATGGAQTTGGASTTTGGSKGIGGAAATGGTKSTGGAAATGGTNSTGTVFSQCRFHFGTIDSKATATASIAAQIDFFTPGWMLGTFNQGYFCTEAAGSLAGKVPVDVTYITANYVKSHHSLCDCNVSGCSA